MRGTVCAYEYHAGALDWDSNATAPTLLAIGPLTPYLYFTSINSYFKRSFINALYLIILSCNYLLLFLINNESQLRFWYIWQSSKRSMCAHSGGYLKT